MHDNWLLLAAMTVSALGIAGLMFALIIMDVPLSTFADASAADDGVTVHVKGDVVRTQARTGFTVVTIEQPATLDIIIDGNVSGNTSGATPFSVGTCVDVRGKKATYRNQTQVSATRISTCKR